MATATDYTALLTGNSWNGLGQIGSPVIVTYSFSTTAPQYVKDQLGGFKPGAASSFQTFSATEKTATRGALAQWSAISGIKFVEVSPGQGEIAFNKVDLDQTPNPDSGGFAITPTRGFFLSGIGVDSSDIDGDIFLDTVTPPTGSFLTYTLLHEIGHTLGLKHPFEGDPIWPGVTTGDTVMAYGAAATSLRAADVNAAQYLYGGTAAPAGTLLSWSYSSSTKVLTQTWGDAASPILGTGQKDVIDGGGGIDQIAGFGNDDWLKGGTGNDRLYGGPGNDRLAGGPGDDIILGGNSINFTGSPEPGTDTADYSTASSAVTVHLRFFFNDAGFQATGADIGSDLLYDIDNVLGGVAGDHITGNQFNNALSGRDGNDTLSGGLGNDTLDGGKGKDHMNGGDGNDTYIVGSSGDVLVDSSGKDTVRSTVTWKLAAGFEKLVLLGSSAINGTGNSAANSITGNSGANKLIGASGNDILVGGAGKDVLVGGAGRDLMTGGSNADTFDFNSVGEMGKTAKTRDVIKDFSTSGGDIIDLASIDANGKSAGSGTFKFLKKEGAAFTGVKGQLHWFESGSKTIVEGDIDGNKKADFQIELTSHKALTPGDFHL